MTMSLPTSYRVLPTNEVDIPDWGRMQILGIFDYEGQEYAFVTSLIPEDEDEVVAHVYYHIAGFLTEIPDGDLYEAILAYGADLFDVDLFGWEEEEGDDEAEEEDTDDDLSDEEDDEEDEGEGDEDGDFDNEEDDEEDDSTEDEDDDGEGEYDDVIGYRDDDSEEE